MAGRLGQSAGGVRLAGSIGGGGGAATLAALYALATAPTDNTVTLTDAAGGVFVDGSGLTTSASPFQVRQTNVGTLQQNLYLARAGGAFIGASAGTPVPATALHVSKGGALGAGLVETFRVDLIPSSGVAAANDGNRWSVYLPNAAGTSVRAATFDTSWAVATAAAETAQMKLQFVNAGALTTTAPLWVTPTRVGVGLSATPAYTFHVQSTNVTQMAVENATGNARLDLIGTGGTTQLRQGSGGGFSFDTPGIGMAFYTNNSTKYPIFVYSADGNSIGLGTVSPLDSNRLLIGGNLANQPSGASAALDFVQVAGTTVTLTGATSITTPTGYNYVTVGRPTYTAASVLNVADAATVYIANSPLPAGSLTFSSGGVTGAKALWVDDGISRFDGHTYCAAGGAGFQAFLGGSGSSIGFYGTTGAVAKQTVTGSKGANAALTSLMAALANLGLVTDTTT